MSDTILATKKRSETGKAHARRIRRAGKIPAVIYGEIKEPISFEIDAHEFELMFREGHSLVTLNIDGKEQQAVIREVQRHPVNSNFLHIDFMSVKKGHKLTMAISIDFVGSAKGSKEGGIFSEVKNELNIEVLPKDIPDTIEINIDDLEIGDAIRVEDLKTDTFEILDDPKDLICQVEQPRVEEESATDEDEDEEESAEPEVITARDKEEDA